MRRVFTAGFSIHDPTWHPKESTWLNIVVDQDHEGRKRVEFVTDAKPNDGGASVSIFMSTEEAVGLARIILAAAGKKELP